MSLEPGQILDGKYRIVRLIGEGGMGAVFEGENTRIQRRVAIKVVHAAYAADTAVMARFQREAQAAGRIGNDHILEVLDLGALPDGSQYMVLEFLDGEPLSARIERLGRLTPKELAPLVVQMLKGLGAAHGAGIFHRDLKPDNLFILKEKAGRADFVKIIDFGISKFQPLSGDAMNMTSTGAVMGTPYYMSPEQASGSRAVDARSDLYSMGVILYECVTGHVPFDGDTFNQLMFKIVLSDAPSPVDAVPDLDPAFASIIMKAMVKDVGQRFQTAEEFSKAVTAWVESGAAVASVPPLDASQTAAQGAARNAFASASGEIPLPSRAASKTGGGVPRGRATGGSWATSQFGAKPPNHKVLVGSIAGGLLLAVGVVVAVVSTRRGSSTPPAVDSATATTNAAVAPPLPANSAPLVPTPPVVASPESVTVAPAPPVASVAPEKDSPSRDHATRRAATKPASSAKPLAPGKPGAKPAGGEPYFGY
jgi:hypothetical protein